MVEESRKKTGCMYLYNWFTVVYAWNWLNIVNQWYFNKNCKKKKDWRGYEIVSNSAIIKAS